MPQANAQIPTRDLLLDAAEHLFATRGYQSTTIKQVAEQVGVQGPAIYKHFGGKRDLFEQVLERLFTPFLELLADGAAAGGDQGAIMRQHLANPNASRIVQQATLSGGEDLALLVERWYRPFFRDVPGDADAAPPGFTPVSVMAFHSMLLGYLTLAPLHEAIFATNPLEENALEELLHLQQRLAAAVGNATP